jgi:hypothetical protein
LSKYLSEFLKWTQITSNSALTLLSSFFKSFESKLTLNSPSYHRKLRSFTKKVFACFAKLNSRMERRHTGVFMSRDIMLGPYDSPESRTKYGRIIAEYLASDGSASFGVEPESLFVGDLVVDYLEHAKTYFGDSTEGRNVKRALAPVAKLYMDIPTTEFGPLQFKAVRADWTHKSMEIHTLADDSQSQKKPSRGYVNAQMSRVLRKESLQDD